MTYCTANYLFSVKCINKMQMPTCWKTDETQLPGCLCFCSYHQQPPTPTAPSPTFLFLHHISSRPGVRAGTLPAEMEPGQSWQSVSQRTEQPLTGGMSWAATMSPYECCRSAQTLVQHEHVCVFKPFQWACPRQSRACNLSLPCSCLGCTLPGTHPLSPKEQHFWLSQAERSEILWLEKCFIQIQNNHLLELVTDATRNILPWSMRSL